RPMRRKPGPVAIIIDGLMRVIPPPTQLLVGEKFLLRIIGIACLREPISLRQRHPKVGPVRIDAVRRRVTAGGAAVVEPIETLTAFDVPLDVFHIVDRRRPGESEPAQLVRRRWPGARVSRRLPFKSVEAAVNS